MTVAERNEQIELTVLNAIRNYGNIWQDFSDVSTTTGLSDTQLRWGLIMNYLSGKIAACHEFGEQVSSFNLHLCSFTSPSMEVQKHLFN